jgi:hypothetical protein
VKKFEMEDENMEYIWDLIYLLIIGALSLFLNIIIPMFLGEQIGVLMIKKCFSSWVKFRGIVYEWMFGGWLVGFIGFLLLLVSFIIVYDRVVIGILGVPRIEVLLPLPMVPILLEFSSILLAFIMGFVITLLMNWWYNMQRPTQSKTESN